jgi:hypothetical protein
MDKHNSHTPLHSTHISQIIAISLGLFGLFLVLVSFLFGILVLATNTTSYNTWIITSVVAGIWFVWVGVTLFERFPPIVVAIRYANIIGLPILGYLHLTTSDVRYIYAGVSLFWCALLVEQAMTIHREFATYYPGFRLVTLLGSWAMSVIALALTIIYIIPLSDARSFASQLGERAPTVILFMGYGFLAMLKKGMTPHTKHSA